MLDVNVKTKTTQEIQITVTITIGDFIKWLNEQCEDVKSADVVESVTAIGGGRELELDSMEGDKIVVVCKTTKIS